MFFEVSTCDFLPFLETSFDLGVIGMGDISFIAVPTMSEFIVFVFLEAGVDSMFNFVNVTMMLVMILCVRRFEHACVIIIIMIVRSDVLFILLLSLIFNLINF